MIRICLVVLAAFVQAEQDKSEEVGVSHSDVVNVLEEASQIKVPDGKEIRDSKDTNLPRPPAPPPPNLPEPPAF